jgi:CheY-like chemotaxis protein
MLQAAEKESKPWVLVVDDSRVVRKTILKILGRDFHIVEAEDGMAGWRSIAQNSRIEAIISDIQMPELDGYHLICKIRAADDPALRELPVIVITSAEDETTRERAYACGASDFILKPFNAGQLVECVRTQLDGRRGREAELTSAEKHKAPAVLAPEIESVVVTDAPIETADDAIERIESGLRALRELSTTALPQRALASLIRFLPFLKQCNTQFNLGLDSQIAAIQARLAAMRSTKPSINS